MSAAVSNLPDFGDYVLIEQKRFSGKNEMYLHKVISRFQSNSWIDVPVVVHNGPVLHDTTEDVLNVVCCGISEDKVIRYRAADCTLQRGLAEKPEADGSGS